MGTRKLLSSGETISIRLARFIIRRQNWIFAVFIAGCVFSAFAMMFVNINYDLTEYVPDTADSSIGLDLMEREFGYPGTARIMIEDVTLYEAKQYKDKLEAVDGVDQILWCDDTVNIYAGEDFINEEDIRDYYRDGCAVMDVTFTESNTSSRTSQAIDAMKAIIGEKGRYVGMAVQNKALQENLASEMQKILIVAGIMIFLILCAATTAWTEPLLFLIVMGVAILLNRGTNVFVGTISFLTQNVAMVLQLATSMDYSIFLLDSFTHEKARGLSDEEAMVNAVDAAINSIFASSLTTVAGFLALTAMHFSIGFDLGLVLAKGIVFSLLTVVFFMPAMIFRFARWNERTAHRSFFPDFHGLAEQIYRHRRGILVAMLLVAPLAYTAQTMNSFIYGNNTVGAGEGTQVYEDDGVIVSKFGRSNMLLAVYPNTSAVRERQMSDEIEALDYVKSVTSMANSLPDGVPEEFLPQSLTEQLHTDGYARMLIYIRTKAESDTAFACTDEIRGIVQRYYPEGAYVVGETASTEDIRTTILADSGRVNRLSLLGVFAVVLFSFRSALVPLIVMIPIEVAIFINMAFPYLMGETMAYMGYLIVSSIQLGATVDYSILLTNNYMACRRTMDKKQACIEAIARSCSSILTSGMILIFAGYIVHFVSSTAAIGELGHLIGRGAVLSVLLVLATLPALLSAADPFIADPERRNMRYRHIKMRHQRIKGWLRRVTAGLLAALTLAISVAKPSLCAWAAEAAADVDETMYVNLDYYGKASRVNVVKSVRANGQSTFTDYGEYTAVENMSDETVPVIGDGSVRWRLPEDAGGRFYYKCTMDNDAVELPWTFDISYRHNGVPVNGEQLAGASGLIEIHITAEPNEKARQYYRDNMLLMVTVPLDMSKCYSVEAEGSQTQSIGSYTGVVFTALPGEEGDYTVRIGTDSFETIGVIMSMVPGTVEDLEHIRDLKEAKDTWRDAGDAMYDSLESMARAVEGMRGGVDDAREGAAAADAAREKWNAEKDGILAGNDRILASLTALSAQLSRMTPHLESAKSEAEDLHENINDLVDVMEEMQDPLEKLFDLLKDVADDSDDLAGRVPELTQELQTLLALDARLQANEQAILTGMNETFPELLTAIAEDYSGDELDLEIDLINDLEPAEERSGKNKESGKKETRVRIATASDAEENSREKTEETNRRSAVFAAAESLSSGSGTLSSNQLLQILSARTSVLEELASDSSRASDSMRDLLQDIANSADNVSELSESMDSLIDYVHILNATLNRYYPELQDMLTDSAQLVNRTAEALDNGTATLELVQNTLRSSSDDISATALHGLRGTMELLDQSLSVLESTTALREAGRTMKDVMDEQLDKFETENRFLYLDPKAEKVSFTSDKNISPGTLQIILRTEEIRLEDKAEILDAEQEAAAASPLRRMWAVLVKMVQAAVQIFRER